MTEADMTRRALGIPDPAVDRRLSDKMLKIMSSSKKAERFAETFLGQLESDEEPLRKVGYYMAKAIRTNSVDDLLIAVCGWSAETLAKMALGEKL